MSNVMIWGRFGKAYSVTFVGNGGFGVGDAGELQADERALHELIIAPLVYSIVS
jgi:hypothetical protein